MRSSFIRVLNVGVVLSLVACVGSGESGERNSSAIPATAQRGVAGPFKAGAHKPHNVPTCSGSGAGSFVGGGFENVAAGAYSGVLEGNSNEVCDEESSIGGGYYNFISSGNNTSYYSFIGSGYDNSISSNGFQSVIGGGNINAVTSPNSVVGGGNQNATAGSDSTIAGGSNNSITSVAQYATIGGGSGNTVSNGYGTVAGGFKNVASGEYGFAGGGEGNRAGGLDSVVGGGFDNVAAGTDSFAGGTKSSAGFNGDFVWSDYASSATALAASTANQFLVRAVGGVAFYSSSNLAAGVELSPGSGTWASLSDRHAKTNVVPVTGDVILDKIAMLPISEWSYTTEGRVRHVGPMAQDFYAAFNVGEDERHITSIDEDGVALAAIKALNQKVAARDAQIGSLQQQLRALAARVDALSKRVR